MQSIQQFPVLSVRTNLKNKNKLTWMHSTQKQKWQKGARYMYINICQYLTLICLIFTFEVVFYIPQCPLCITHVVAQTNVKHNLHWHRLNRTLLTTNLINIFNVQKVLLKRCWYRHISQTVNFVGPTLAQRGSCRLQVEPTLAKLALLSWTVIPGTFFKKWHIWYRHCASVNICRVHVQGPIHKWQSYYFVQWQASRNYYMCW